ncbi:hypothetical protein Aperf_G00000040013 [Anoplocephala perfoliata]
MFNTSLLNKSPTSSTNDVYTLPPVLQSFLSRDSSRKTVSLDKAPLITDVPENDVSRPSDSSSSIFTRPLLMFSVPVASEPESFRGLSRSQRLFYFVVSIFCASLFFSLALIFIPLLATPSGLRKFVFMYILGNVALLFAFAFAFGPWTYIKSLLTKDRILSTLAYGGSLFLGIYGVIWWRSTICAFFAIAIQIGLGLCQLKQYIWGGTKVFSFFSKIPSWRPNGSVGSSLPI